MSELAQQYGCTVKQREVFDDDVYFVTVPKTQTMGAMRLANVFYETGLFVWAAPDMIAFDATDV